MLPLEHLPTSLIALDVSRLPASTTGVFDLSHLPHATELVMDDEAVCLDNLSHGDQLPPLLRELKLCLAEQREGGADLLQSRSTASRS
jgi:hypothetical protein